MFNQFPLLFAVSLPLGLAKTAARRAAVESFVIYIIFNYFIETILSFWGSSFGVDFSIEVGGTSGLTMIAGIKTLDMSVIGAILIAAIVVWIHNKWYESKLPEVLSVFQGSALVVIIGFICMIPLAFVVSWFWPMVQHGVKSHGCWAHVSDVTIRLFPYPQATSFRLFATSGTSLHNGWVTQVMAKTLWMDISYLGETE
ncbi:MULTISPECIES: PTS transporter subunit EIIC [Clostridia]|uniref:PTS transporter subunit EIIC n=1 Tax=Clostridia TaxID=186801 RepID=UPI000EA3DC56|nr:PTS transporter subunit EIIC [Clostridium sp. 1xD42-85]NBJ68162.1 hypothetical protein [Roseburia sp. 1XD42-34]RKI81935.1 hypothetical protein D7V87_01540 [Clostridium sp. 1xD42-85]